MSHVYKNASIAFMLVFVPFLLVSQTLQQMPEELTKSAPYNKVLKTGFEVLEADIISSPHDPSAVVGFRTEAEITIGETVYDLQSNSTSCKRMSMMPDGRIVSTWTMGFEDDAYPERGTGYNQRLDYVWGDIPTERLETERIGWPNHNFTASGAEVIISHTSNNELKVLRRGSALEAWTESSVSTNTPDGLLWPRAAVGGADGESIHLIAITTTVVLEGTIYEGLDGHILYFRSTDGGATWDQTDIKLPELDSDNQASHPADSYYIDARGDNVAIGIFNDWDDVLLYKSADNGDSWTKHIINDFPLEKYVINSGYTTADIPLDPQAPDTMAIFSSDSYGSIVIDHDGMAHAFFGQMYISDVDLVDAGSTYFPATDGMAYWNESFGNDSIQTIVGMVDQNLNDTIDIVAIADIATYFASLTSMPSAGIDAGGNLFLAYSGVIEGEVSPSDAQHYRNVYFIASQDGGSTWTEPFDVNIPELAIEPDLADFIEGVFPSIVRDVDNNLRLLYMQDFRPGLSVRGDEDDASNNFMNYVQVSVEDLGLVATEELVAPETFDLKVYPTVSRQNVTLNFDLETAGQVAIDIVNLHGQLVQNVWNGQLATGAQQQTLDLSNLNAATYYIIIRSNEKYAAVPVIKQ